MSVNLFAEKIVLLQQACYNHTSFFFLEKTIVLVDPICSARSPGEPQRPHQEDVEELQMLLEGEVLQQAWSFGEKLQIRNKNKKVCDSLRNHQFFVSTIVSRLCSW
jgi:hypothetical protein